MALKSVLCGFFSYSTTLLFTRRVIKGIKVLRILRVIKLVRLLRLRHSFTVAEGIMGKHMFHTFRFLFAVAAAAHWSACLFHFVADMNEDITLTWLFDYGMVGEGHWIR